MNSDYTVVKVIFNLESYFYDECQLYEDERIRLNEDLIEIKSTMQLQDTQLYSVQQ